MKALGLGYMQSFGTLIVFTAVLLAFTLMVKPARTALKNLLSARRGILFVAVFALIENLIMRQHAIAYTFDRMKGVFPLLIVLLLCVTAIYEITGKHIVAAGAVCLAAAVMSGTNLYGYVADNRHFKRDLSYLRTNREIAQTLTAEYTPENSVYAQNTAVRGYSNLLFGRGIYEGVTLDKAIPIAQAKGKRYVIAFTISQGAWNMYDYGDYTVYDLDNSDME